MTIWEVGGQPLVDRLRELHGKDMSFARIANQLSAEFNIRVSRNACIGKATRMGFPIRARTYAERGARGHVTTPRKRVSRIQSAGVGIVRRVRVSIEEIRLQLADVVPLHVSFDDLRHDQCRYPYGDALPFTFCGCEKLPGASYCEPHQRLTRSGSMMTAEEYALHKRAYREKMIAEAA